MFAVREALGQLHEYRYLCGPHEAALCILLDRSPDRATIRYVEDHLGLLVAWVADGAVFGGTKTAAHLGAVGVRPGAAS